MRKFREKLRHREALAIQEGADLLDILMADPIRDNEEIDGAIVVHITGALEHRMSGVSKKEPYGYGDSYEAVRIRFGEAIEAAPKCIILRVDSPGGVVSGLNQCVFSLQRMKRDAGIPVYVFVDELCASAMYAIACVGDEIYGPESCIAGSIGVISTMCDQVAADKKDGLNFVTITSGKRKADGHPHVTISEDAVAAEKVRVRQLADQFFAIVKDARGIDAKGLEAAIFTGKDAVSAGVIDDVMGWEELLAQIGLAYSENTVSRSPERNSDHGDAFANEGRMNLRSMIEKTKASLKSERNPAKRKALTAKLAGYQATFADLEAAKKTYKKSTHVEETEEDDPSDEEEEGGGGNDTDRDEEEEPSDDKDDDKDGDEESAEFPEKKGKKAKSKASSEEDEESDDKEEESAEMDDDEEEKALRAAIGKLSGRAKAAAQGALRAVLEKARRADSQAGDIAALKRAEIGRKKEALISAKLAGGYITKKTAAELRGKKLAFVEPYLAMQKSRIFNREGGELIPKDENAPGGGGHAFTEQQEHMFAVAAAKSNGTVTVAQLREAAASAGKPNGVVKNPVIVAGGQIVPKGGY